MIRAEASLSDLSHAKMLQNLSRFRVVLTILVLSALLTLFIVGVDHSLLGRGFQELWRRPGLISLVAIGYGSAFLLRAIAWRSLFPRGETVPSIGRLFSILHLSLVANHLFPFKAGEVLRPMLAARAGASFPTAVISTISSRLLDMIALLAITAALIPLTIGVADARAVIIPIFLTGIAGVSLLWMRVAPAIDTRIKMLDRLWIRAQDALKTLTVRQLMTSFSYTVPSWLLESVVVYSAAQALGIELSWPAAAAVTAFTILFQVVHFTPGGIGIYEASMAAALQVQGVDPAQAITLAVLTHAIKFVYAFGAGGSLGLLSGIRIPTLAKLRGSRDDAKTASRFEIIAARLWNILNEGKPFTPVFSLGVLILLGLPNFTEPVYWVHLAVAIVALAPLIVILYQYDFPLRLRAVLWVALAAMLALTRFVDVAAVALIVVLYFGFTVVFWGSIYYHLRIGTALTNFTRFWRLVLENPDPTSGNFLEQMPKLLITVLLARYLTDSFTTSAVIAVEAYTILFALVAVLVHQWWFTWVPGDPLAPTRLVADSEKRISQRVLLIVIDGCRADRFAEADTPFLDSLAADGLRCDDMRTVYPARTVTAFSSMLSGASPHVHGMRSNFVPSLGIKCESIFDALDSNEMKGQLVGIAHLVDAFGEESVKTVTAVTPNDEIDDALVARAKAVLETDNPELLVLQTLSVDQTGHARGSYYPEYLNRIEETDRLLGQFIEWCHDKGYLENTTVFVTSDHGQGRGIGGHGHLTEPERRVPFIAWGQGVPKGIELDGTRTLHDVAPTLAYYLGVQPPAQSVGQVLVTPAGEPARAAGPLAVIIPAFNEAETLPEVLEKIPRERIADLEVIVVDDGSEDGTEDVARAHGAEHVIVHSHNRGLGAALRTGLETARDLDARAAVYLDADLEYDPREIPALIDLIESGEADYVLGSRFSGTREGHPLARSLGNRVFTALLSLMTGRRISDGQTGFRAFSSRAIAVAEISHDYNYAQVLTLNLLRKGLLLREVPISYRHRSAGSSFISLQYLWRVPFGMARELIRN